jgi:hypothetical protein
MHRGIRHLRQRYAQYIVSDTMASARKVTDAFGDSIQTDCAMHRLNLLISYGIGMKENTRTTMVTNVNIRQREKVVRVVTPAGALPEGGRRLRSGGAQQHLQYQSAH